MHNTSIKIDRVSAVYGRGANQVQALHQVSLAIEYGEIFGLLGPNGAGKTTLLSCLEGLVRPVGGQIWLDGIDVLQEPAAAKNRLGIQLQRTALLDNLTAMELVEVYAALYQVYLTRSQIGDLLERFGLSEQRKSLVQQLSGGQAQRLALALAIANDPYIVLLDEPTAGLDPHARRAVWGMVRQLHTDGRTILITTHAMEEAEALCGRVAIIDRGQVIACDTPAHLVASLGAHPMLKTSLELPLDQVDSLPGVVSSRYSGQYLEIESSQPQDTLACLHNLATSQGRTIGDVTLRQPNLEDVFLKLTGRPLSV